MHKLDYHDKKRVLVSISAVLFDRGWNVFGFHKDESDSMTDYFHPARWEGVAEKDGLVLVCDVDGYDAKKSGMAITRHEMLPGVCTPCGGSGKTRLGRDAYTTRTLIGNVITNHPAVLAGSACEWCEGSGNRIESREVPTGESWPIFTPTQKGSKWHLERNGKIIAKGNTLYAPIAREDKWNGNQEKAAALFLDEILAKVNSPAPSSNAPAPTITSDQVMIRAGTRDGFTQIVFPGKPDAAVRDTLKAAGFRWAPSSGCWYGRTENVPMDVLGLTTA